MMVNSLLKKLAFKPDYSTKNKTDDFNHQLDFLALTLTGIKCKKNVVKSCLSRWCSVL